MFEQGQIPRTRSNRDRRVKHLRLEAEGTPILYPSDVTPLLRDSDARERLAHFNYCLLAYARTNGDISFTASTNRLIASYTERARHYRRILEGAGAFTAGCRR